MGIKWFGSVAHGAPNATCRIPLARGISGWSSLRRACRPRAATLCSRAPHTRTNSCEVAGCGAVYHAFERPPYPRSRAGRRCAAPAAGAGGKHGAHPQQHHRLTRPRVPGGDFHPVCPSNSARHPRRSICSLGIPRILALIGQAEPSCRSTFDRSRTWARSFSPSRSVLALHRPPARPPRRGEGAA